jgi:tryptophan synthase alpha chain
MSRIGETFKRLKAQERTGLIAYVMVGCPDVPATLELVPAIAQAGADMVELGVPFSDPLADGATVQRASQAALRNGVTLAMCLDVCESLRSKMPATPLVLMPYYNTILAYGLDRFARRAHEAGADGVIVPDLPPEEAQPLLEACKLQGIAVIFLVAPTSTDARLEAVGKVARGFLYCVSLTGVTGARAELSSDLPAFLARVRRHVKVPLAVGFGISSAEHVRAVGEHADAAIVGSALVKVIEEAPVKERVERARRFVAALSQGASRSASGKRSG